MGGKKLYIFLIFILLGGNSMAQFADTMKVAASEKYKASVIKRFLLGSNYRKEWNTDVRMPVFNIQKEKGGFIIKELGGGMQTKTLELQDTHGNIWALRTVDKEVEKTLPPRLQKTFIKKLVQDMISAAHPYAALTIPVLASAAGVPTGSQQLFFVPDDPALGAYRSLFANQVCILEQRSLPNYTIDTLETEEVLERLVTENDRVINQKNLLKARLLDMLIADWDRHAGQWKWALSQNDGKKTFEALPRDRDQAYFNSNGFLVRLVTFLFMPHMRGFKYNMSGLQKLNLKSWSFDKDLLNQLDKTTWENTVKEFCSNISDSVIHAAILQLPPEIYAVSGAKLEQKLRARRNGLHKNVMKYYNFLSENVNINGSDETEHFQVVAAKDKVIVTVVSANNETIYRRIFDTDETNKVILSGLGDKDTYKVDGKVEGIKLIIDGGKGDDKLALGNNPNIKLIDTAQR